MDSERLLGEAETSDDSRARADVEGAASSNRDEGAAAEPLGWHLVFSYGLGHVLNDLSASIWFFYAVLYSQQVLDLSEKLTGGIILIGQTVDGLTTPLVGYASDHTRTFLGARKPWHLLGVVCVAFTFPVIFGGCMLGATQDSPVLSKLCILSPWDASRRNVGLLILFISIFQIGWASSQVSHLALMPDIAHGKKHRTTLSSVRYGVTVTCNIFVLLALWVLLDTHNRGGGKAVACDMRLRREDKPLFQLLSWAVTAVGILCATGFYLGIPSHPKNTHHNANDGAQEGAEAEAEARAGSPSDNGAGESLQDVLVKWNFFEDPLFWKHGLLYMLSRLMINLNMVYMPLYVQTTMRMQKSSIAIIPLLMYLFSLFGSFLQNKLNHKFGRVVSFTIGGVLQTLGSLSLFVLPRSLSWLMYIVAPLIGLAGTSMLVTVISMTSDFIGKKSSVSAKVFGLYSFSDKLCSGIAVYIIQGCIRCGDCCVNESCCSTFYRWALGLVPLGAALLSFAILLLWRKMKTRKRNKLVREESQLLINPTESYADIKAQKYKMYGALE